MSKKYVCLSVCLLYVERFVCLSVCLSVCLPAPRPRNGTRTPRRPTEAFERLPERPKGPRETPRTPGRPQDDPKTTPADPRRRREDPPDPETTFLFLAARVGEAKITEVRPQKFFLLSGWGGFGNFGPSKCQITG